MKPWLLSALVMLAALAALPAASPAQSSTCARFNGPTCTIRLSTGITMRYLEVGRGNSPLIFLLHGYPGSSVDWSRVVPALHRLLPRADIVVPDLRGHGQSSMPAGPKCPRAPQRCFRWKQFAADIVAFMDARHVRRAVMVGHSAGTLVAQELGLSYPRRVSRLVLISTAAAGQEPAVKSLLDDVVEGAWRKAFKAHGYRWPAGVYNLPPTVAAPGLRQFLKQFDGSAVAPPWLPRKVQRAAAATRLGTWIGVLKNIYAANNIRRLRHLRAPTLVLYATQDFIFTPADEQTLINSLTAAARGPGSFWFKQYGKLPPPSSGAQTDLGHELIWEAPAGVARDIASFITRGRPTRTLYRTAYPSNVRRVIAVPGRAVLIHRS